MGRDIGFRANVGILVVNSEGLVLAGERDDPSGAWQLPQGGVDRGETPEEALYRELREETGIKRSQVKIVDVHPDWLTYVWPPDIQESKGWLGQSQKWFVVKVKHGVEPSSSRSDDEFRNFKWMTMSNLVDIAIKMRRPTYKRLAVDFAKHLAK
jgi:putative (di)nucleoside polyphosphate hydrolase